jgi:beta-mannosidase
MFWRGAIARVVSILIDWIFRRKTLRGEVRWIPAVTAASCSWQAAPAESISAVPLRRQLSLNGAWQLSRGGTQEAIPATVPGCVHSALLAAGRLPDPFYRQNEEVVRWVGESEWVYRRHFNFAPAMLTLDCILLRCEGLDTLAEIRINGALVGKADNMFRLWEFNIEKFVRAGPNSIEIAFASPLPYMSARQSERKLAEWVREHEPKGRAWVRKRPSCFGWDWGPVLVTSGIFRDISIEVFEHARIEDVLIKQNHTPGQRVGLEIELTVQSDRPGPLHAIISVSHAGAEIAMSWIDIHEDKGHAYLEIASANLWWPAGMGDQPLYDVQVELFDAQGRLLDRSFRRIGLRKMILLPADGVNGLRFEVNGVTFFAKGANWIPTDALSSDVSPEILRRYVKDAIAVNMNMLRFWGGGYYEEDELFDACDEAGLCVWMDFKFACSSYPVFENAFLESVVQEVRDSVRRIRHHPCIAVWCGNNEVGYMVGDTWSDTSMGLTDYRELFEKRLARQVSELAPLASYVSGSPAAGDTHYWEVWHGNETFEAYRKVTGFASEFGYQSFPVSQTVCAFTSKEDRSSLLSDVMIWHQRSEAGNQKILKMISEYCRTPKDFDSTLWLSQIVQGYGVKLGVEHLRRTMPLSMGSLYWQYNDCWPAISWSSIDYFGRWKALHYMARHFYAPLMISALEDPDSRSVEVFVTSDRPRPCEGTAIWNLSDTAGRALAGGTIAISIPERQSRSIQRLDLDDLARIHGAGDLIVSIALQTDGEIVSRNMVTLVRPKNLRLQEPGLRAAVSLADGGFKVSLDSEKPALWTWIELENTDARLSDNFVHVHPNAAVDLIVYPLKPITTAEFMSALRVRSLYDTYI